MYKIILSFPLLLRFALLLMLLATLGSVPFRSVRFGGRKTVCAGGEEDYAWRSARRTALCTADLAIDSDIGG